MDAKTLMLIIFLPFLCFGQKFKYPKDTIYVKFEKKLGNKKWYGNYGYGKNKKKGVLFNLKDNNNQSMSFFIEKGQSSDTLCYKHLKDYTFSNLKEINEKRYKWIFKNKRPPANRNGVFQTYLIEIISEEKFVIYPVIWRNEKL